MPASIPFEGMTVGLFETRRQREFGAMFAARGGQVVSCPLIFPESHGVEEPANTDDRGVAGVDEHIAAKDDF